VEAEEDESPEPVKETKVPQPIEEQLSLDQVLDDFNSRLNVIEATLFRLRNI